MKKILQEFKQFAMRGNVVDMAVGIIIGGAVLLFGGGFCLYWFVFRKKKITLR